jgi:hypothetical protein
MKRYLLYTNTVSHLIFIPIRKGFVIARHHSAEPLSRSALRGFHTFTKSAKPRKPHGKY